MLLENSVGMEMISARFDMGRELDAKICDDLKDKLKVICLNTGLIETIKYVLPINHFFARTFWRSLEGREDRFRYIPRRQPS